MKVLKTLEKFKEKQSEDHTVIAWFRSNYNLQKLVMAWPKVMVMPNGKAGKFPKSENEQWAWIWQHYNFSMQEWLSLAAIQNERFGMKLIDRIIRLRLVFPDGTYPQWLERYMQLGAIGLVQSLVKGSGNDGKEEE